MRILSVAHREKSESWILGRTGEVVEGLFRNLFWKPGLGACTL
jgi:hypothetical protein